MFLFPTSPCRTAAWRGAPLALLAVLLAACQTAGTTVPEPVRLESRLSGPLFEAAETAIAEGRIADAKAMLERLFVADAGRARAKLLLAELRLATGEAEAAAQGFSALIEDKELGVRAEQGLGLALMLRRKPDEAAAHLESAVAADPALWRAWNALGVYADTRGDAAAAERAYAKALELRPAAAFLYNNRGYSRMLRGSIEPAIADLTRALELDAGLAVARYNLRLAYAWKGRYEQAVLGAERADMPRVLNNVGFIALLRGDYDVAEGYFVRAVKADATYNKAAWRNLDYLEGLRKLGKGE